MKISQHQRKTIQAARKSEKQRRIDKRKLEEFLQANFNRLMARWARA